MNHPHLSAHIDECDEDALSYMTDLEVGEVDLLVLVECAGKQNSHNTFFFPPQIESFKNNKLGFRIRFHFRRNPYFQNNIIMKELHLGMGGNYSVIMQKSEHN